MTTENKLTLMEHLIELRRRLMWAALAVLITSGICLIFANRILTFLIQPAGNINIVYTEMAEMFSTYIKVSLGSGVALAMPLIVYHLIMFVAPALTSKEKRFLYSVLPGVFAAFAAGVAFGYYILLPPAIRFLLTFGGEIATPFIRIGNYMSVVITLLFWIGLCFELPVVIFFLAKLGIVSPRSLSKKRAFAVVGAFVLGAMVTPTSDPLNQALVAAPLIVLYEIGILLARLAWRDRPAPGPAK